MIQEFRIINCWLGVWGIFQYVRKFLDLFTERLSHNGVKTTPNSWGHALFPKGAELSKIDIFGIFWICSHDFWGGFLQKMCPLVKYWCLFFTPRTRGLGKPQGINHFSWLLFDGEN